MKNQVRLPSRFAVVRLVEVVMDNRRRVPPIPQEPKHKREPGDTGEVGVESYGNANEADARNITLVDEWGGENPMIARRVSDFETTEEVRH